MKIDHIGYAVKRIDRAIESFQKLGYVFGDVIDDKDRNVKLAFGENDGYRIELVSPLNKEIDSPVDIYVKNVGPTPYHICYISEQFETDIQILVSNGFKEIIKPQPAVAFDNNRVVFLMNIYMGLIELVEV